MRLPKSIKKLTFQKLQPVPRSERKQIYLPEFVIALRRTPYLPPRYASFHVPLNFNKLDLRDYLQRVYGVTALSIRSFVEQQKVTRLRPMNRPGFGRLRRPASRKRMTVEMTEPFVWPDMPKDTSAWEKDQYFNAEKHSKTISEAREPEAAYRPNEVERDTYEEQAKQLLKGERPWRPTWQALGLKYDRSAFGGRRTGA